MMVLGSKSHYGYGIWDLMPAFQYLDPLGSRNPSKQVGETQKHQRKSQMPDLKQREALERFRTPPGPYAAIYSRPKHLPRQFVVV